MTNISFTGSHMADGGEILTAMIEARIRYNSAGLPMVFDVSGCTNISIAGNDFLQVLMMSVPEMIHIRKD
ncbi:hypothetical protein M422DRAFT_39565 [Sphaerobolus stellatus SS14]|uniref:STAS domain-containing protein n=1 Tax=Sphaerobolus stellatus (strain SS14) TaxID=990650 RepID=A0A0C9UDN3_SPHS4|nr:hypothetical protein M422DRAFT_39565 [Sphaerobolus stellatus SS14]